MYTIYPTECIVLNSYSRGEASRVLVLFTREFGLVYAHAQGLRELKSKLRYALQDFSEARVNLVRGKSGWKVTSAEVVSTSFTSRNDHEYNNDYDHVRNNVRLRRPTSHGAGNDSDNVTARVQTLARVARLLRRLCGEEKNEKLFDEVRGVFLMLKNTPLSHDYIFNIEIIVVMRILAHLGYWGEDERLTPFLECDIADRALLEQANKLKPFAIRQINKALQETQL